MIVIDLKPSVQEWKPKTVSMTFETREDVLMFREMVDKMESVPNLKYNIESMETIGNFQIMCEQLLKN